MAFYKPNLIIIKSNYCQNAQKGECFLDDFEALVREIDVRALVLQNCLRPANIDFAHYYAIAISF
jgi:hypothetical protein